MQKLYTDIDYDSFPVPDLDLDIHWTLLPIAVYEEQQKARQAKLAEQRIAAQPSDHQVILVPADAAYSPDQEELWPIINHAIQAVIKKYPEVQSEVIQTIVHSINDYRGWRNPYPVCLDYPDRPIRKVSRA